MKFTLVFFGLLAIYCDSLGLDKVFDISYKGADNLPKVPVVITYTGKAEWIAFAWKYYNVNWTTEK